MHKYGYSSPTDGNYYIDGKVFSVGEDFRTPARYKEYKDVGFDVLLLQANDPYLGEEWEKSQTKKNMDNASKGGIDKIIVYDKRIHDLSKTENGLIGEDFMDEEALTSFLENCVKDYSKHPSFYGVMLVDEPSYKCFDSIGQIERCLKRISPNIYIQCNLLPFYGDKKKLSPISIYSQREAYIDYIEQFISKTPHDVITMDSYPIRRENCRDFLINTHFSGYQIVSDMAKKHHRKKGFVLESTAMLVNMKDKFRKLNKGTIEYQYAAALCFGANEISYFTYWAKQRNKTDDEYFPDGTAFISRDGRKTEIYDAVAMIHEEYESIERLLEDYEYSSSCVINSPLKGDSLEEDVGIKVDTDAPLLATKLVNGASCLYCLMNLDDPDETMHIKDVAVHFGEDKAYTVKKKNGTVGEGAREECVISLKNGEVAFIEVKNV